MDKLRPGDVSPTATLPDEYRNAHDVSPLSPVLEAERYAPRRAASRRWRTFPNDYFDVSPESPPDHLQQMWRTSPYTQTSALYPQDSSGGAQLGRSGTDPGDREAHLISEHLPDTTLEEERRLSIDSLQQAGSENGEEKRHIRLPPVMLTDSPNFTCSYWRPIWLRDWCLISLGASCAILAIAILTLYLVSSRNKGLGSYGGSTNLVYLWKYMPTAGIVATNSLSPVTLLISRCSACHYIISLEQRRFYS